jgi:hypothetical protein
MPAYSEDDDDYSYDEFPTRGRGSTPSINFAASPLPPPPTSQHAPSTPPPHGNSLPPIGAIDDVFVQQNVSVLSTHSSPYQPFTLLKRKRLYVCWWRVDGGQETFSFSLTLKVDQALVKINLPSPSSEMWNEIEGLEEDVVAQMVQRELKWEICLPPGKNFSLAAGESKKFITDELFGFSASIAYMQTTLDL